MIKISIIVCTYQNPSMLQETLNSLIIQTLAPEIFEVIVVDNNSKDSTYEVVCEYEKKATNVRYVYEENQGLSFARNKGIGVSKADIVAFIDDDAIADKCWIEKILEPYELMDDIWAVGGKTLPLWRAPRPTWITDDNLHSLSVRDYGEKSRELIWPERMIGVNCSFRKEIFSKIGYFDTQLGRKKNILFDQEDTEIQKGIHEQGKKVYYSPDALVHHIITKNRTNPDYFIKRSSGHFRTNCILDYSMNRKLFRKNFFQRLKAIPRAMINYLHDRSDINKKQRFYVNIGYVQQGLILINPFRNHKLY
jgi:glycosyltransferase involved in cell wall biosynthesis